MGFGTKKKSNKTILFAGAPAMPHNVTVVDNSPTSVLLKSEGPRKTGGLPVTSWRIIYEELHVNVEKSFFFSTGTSENKDNQDSMENCTFHSLSNRK